MSFLPPWPNQQSHLSKSTEGRGAQNSNWEGPFESLPGFCEVIRRPMQTLVSTEPNVNWILGAPQVGVCLSKRGTTPCYIGQWTSANFPILTLTHAGTSSEFYFFQGK